jgi:hypothetical protein
MMTMEERTAAVERLGFTERQARFLVHVMLFSGLCLPRQYARAAGTAYGHNVTNFFTKLVRDRRVTACPCLHNRGRLYHVHDRRLYAAIGEPCHPHRRPVPARQVIDRLMRLDCVLAQPKIRWLVTEAEKVAHVRRLAPSFPTARLPQIASGGSSRRRLRLFPEDVLMGIGESQETTFVYVVTSPAEDDWRRVVGRYGHLLGALPRWVFRACFPPDHKAGMLRFYILFREELAEPLSPGTLSDVRWHFEQLRGPVARRGPHEEERFIRGQVQLLVSPRFRALHQRWLVDGEAALELASSPAIVEHLGDFTGQVNCVLLPVSYRHVFPLVSPDRMRCKRVEEGVGQGAMNGKEAPHVLDPRPPTASLSMLQTARPTDTV